MACERWREMLSAQLDGEDDPAERAAVDAHLAGCAGCQEWLDRAASVNRLTSTSMATPPDLTASILAALPGWAGDPAEAGPTGDAGLAAASVTAVDGSAGERPSGGTGKRTGLGRWRRWSGRLREFPIAGALLVALAAVGAVQLILGLDQIGGGVVGAHVHTGPDANPGHLWHESAAWNVAVGTGYLFIALRRTRPSGLVPMLTAFVGMLLLLSVNDLTAARVDAARLISHGFVILGYLLIVALSRIPGGFASTPPGARSGGGTWRASFAGSDDEEPVAETYRPGLRLVPRGPMTAEHDETRAA
ncbi:zf-HC2 domain-containing protein [Paractinoplanes lichenicola]|uniref:Zf-HC2 domain-containing protein n=1 Tax=Paractinoplanes lichenicola TaxID=2802976 RepID=A0ABS1W2D5_9ACTN|nr:zf-HC2 domain-containing protein [Actinoplanes lichenicola]MBL7260862.1 zf-HC2 domain-containing protein [Actinoplanes lichenicola]